MVVRAKSKRQYSPDFIQASMRNTCHNEILEGSAKLYSLDILTAGSASNLDPNNDTADYNTKNRSD